MEKGKPAADEVASSLEHLRLNSRPKSIPLSTVPGFFSSQLKKSKPRRLLSLCLGLLGENLEDIIIDILEIAPGLPPDIKLALAAIARRRKLLDDDVLIALADISWELLDVSGSDVSDKGLEKVANICTNLHAVDISRCDRITALGVSELISHCPSLEILRCGGCPRSDFTARRCLSILKPKLNNIEEESWEDLDSMDIGSGAQSLRWLIWPKIDDDSKLSLASECPRIVVNPQPSHLGSRGVQVPSEAFSTITLDHSVVEDIDPKTWAALIASKRVTPQPRANNNDANEIPLAEKFRLAFLERDARLAPKRAKNARQHKRRAEKEFLSNSTDAKSIVLASRAMKFLNNRS